MAAVPLSLRALSERAGILSRYIDNEHQVRETSDDTRRALLACLGFDAADEAVARRTLAGLDQERAARLVEPVRVAHEGEARQVAARSPALAGGTLGYEIVATSEQTGRRHVARGVARVDGGGTVAGLRAPGLATGTYRLAIELDSGSVRTTVEQWLAVAPPTCTPLRKKLGRRRAFGIWSNLYALRSGRGLGVGNLADLEQLARLTARAGGEFVGVNPLHALRNRGLEVSPYSPLSRLFRNPIYIAPERVPEMTASEGAKNLMASHDFVCALDRARASERIDYPLVVSLLTRLLEAAWRTFRERARAERTRAFERYRSEEGQALRDFATFCAIEEQMTAAGKPRDWRQWPVELRDPTSAAVAEFRARNAERVDFHSFVQFECDRQLALAARVARRAGMAIGLYTDMAVGSLASSFDAWAFPGLFLSRASLGAPPDAYSATGQNWGLPPINPRALRADRYRYWRLMLRAAFRHCGMLRLDHAMGVLRQFWIPEGGSGVDGAYVSFPAGDMLALLALESRAGDAVVVGEDLGTVPAGFSELLARHAILSSRVMFFERTPRDGFKRAAVYSRSALVTANTHDQPTLAGWWKGRDLEIRREVGLLAGDHELEDARRVREEEKRRLAGRLRAERALARTRDAENPAELCAAVHRFLAATPAPLLGISLDDVAGETEPVNVPGVSVDEYPSWSRRMQLGIEELPRSPAVARALDGVKSRAAKRTRPMRRAKKKS